MTEEYIANMKTGFQPMMDLADINRQAFEKLASMQTEYLSNCFNANFDQFKALSETQDPQTATELQIQYCKGMGDKLTDVAEQKIAVYTAAQVAFIDALQESCSRMNEFFPKQAETAKAPAKKAPAQKVS